MITETIDEDDNGPSSRFGEYNRGRSHAQAHGRNGHGGSTGNGHSRAAAAPLREINLLTLNCWGLLHISAQRQPRIAHIGRLLASESGPGPSGSESAARPDIVCLQELFTQEDYHAIRRETRLTLPYGKFYHSGAFGSGLAILSRWPIEESSMMPYPLNGRPTAFWRGDWYVGKGVACARIRFGSGLKDVIEVFNTHTHAPYEKEPNDSYICHRTAQAWELSKLARGASERGHLVAALGDFNMLPLSLAYRLVTTHAPLRDAWRVLHPDSALGPSGHPAEASRRLPVPSAAFNISVNGATSNNVYNTWRWNKAQLRRLRSGSPCRIDPETPDPQGQRLDYIFVSTGNSGSDYGTGNGNGTDTRPGWIIKSASVTMTDRHPDLGVSLSDHFAVQATIAYHQPNPTSTLPHQLSPSRDPPSRPLTASTTALQTGAFLAAPDSPTSSTFRGRTHGRDDDHDDYDGSNGDARRRRPGHPADYDAQLRYQNVSPDSLPIPMYDEILAMIHWYSAREQKQRRWRGAHFFIALAVWLACLIAVWFSPANYVAFILMLVASLGLVSGVIDGLLALLFFSSEIRCLKEFEWEIRNAKAVATGDLVALAESDSYAAKADGWHA